jgi:pimeloyl-ACP methyl ester carboxylesterase
MKFLFLIIIIGFCCKSLSAQDIAPTKRDVLEKFGFKEHSIIIESDTTFFYYHQKPDKTPDKLVLYLQGTSPDPLFSVEKEKNKFAIYRWFPADYKLLDENYAYAVIAKAGIPAIQRTEQSNYEKYHNLNSLDYRVKQADTVINFIKNKLIQDVDQIIVYGHSEGAPVAAKLATINSHITHLGFWAGNALPDFYDFALFNSKAVAKGKMTTEDAKKNVMELFDSFNEIARNKDATEASSKDDYTNKRWWSYAEPPLNNLLKIDIPIYVQVAGNDQSAPIESTYLIPLEFIRLGKTNLTYEICANCDHGFTTKDKDMWEDIFLKFMTWTQE